MSKQAKPNIVVIGAGIGGLSAAVDLSCQGAVVTLLESHNDVGGKMHQTRINDTPIDTGPTVFTMRAVFDQLFLRAGTTLEERVGLSKLDQLARHFWHDGSTLDLFSDVEKTCHAIENLTNSKEAGKYRAFAKKSEAVFNALDDSFMKRERPGVMQLGTQAGLINLCRILSSPPFISLWQSMCLSFNDARLRQLFARYSTYCGSSPFEAPATLMLIAHAERAGVWVIKDGMQSLAYALADLAKEHDCDIRLNTTAQRIDCTSGTVSGVTLADGTFVKADAVIYNGEVNALQNGWLGQAVRNAVPMRKANSLSAITLSCLAQVRESQLCFHNVFFGKDYQAEFDAIFKNQAITSDPTIYVCASDQHNIQSTAPPTKQRLFCLMNAPAKTFDNNQISEETNKLLNTLASHGLHIQSELDEQVIATPNTFEQRFPGSDGALYGAPTHGWLGSFSRNGSRSSVPGLYLAGGGVHPGAGVPMVSLSGQLAARSLLNDLSTC